MELEPDEDSEKQLEDDSQEIEKKVEELNLQNTKFDNPIGMDSDNNYSSARDISTILLYSLKNETFKEIF